MGTNIFIRRTKDLSLATTTDNRLDPVTSFSFALNYYLTKLKPVSYRITNLLIHISCGIIIYFLAALGYHLLHLSEHRRFLAALSALIFISHPVNTTAVAYLSNRAIPLSTLFYLLSIWLYLLGRTASSNSTTFFKTIKYIAGSAAGFLAVLTNPACISLILIIIAFEYLILGNSPCSLNRQLLKIVTLVSSGIVAVFVYSSHANHASYGFLSAARVTLHYFSLVLFPFVFRFNFSRKFPLSRSLFDPPSTFISLMFIGGLVYLILYGIKASHNPERSETENRDNPLTGFFRLLSFGLTWFLINLWAGFLVSPGATITEERLYLPAIWLYPAAVYLIERYFVSGEETKSQARRISIAVSLLFLLSWGTYARNQDWRSEAAMLHATDEYAAKDEKAYFKLALGRLKKNDRKKAKRYLKKAILVEKNFPEATLKLADIFYGEKDWEEAEKYYRLALKNRPAYPEALLGLGKIYREAKEMPSEAYPFISRAIEENPDFPPAYLQMAKLFFYNWGNSEKARENLKKCLELDPGNKQATNLLKILNK
ncbi:MAG: tetratricopeptide repeat protein [bacterium]